MNDRHNKTVWWLPSRQEDPAGMEDYGHHNNVQLVHGSLSQVLIEAARSLNQGQLVAFPTETVYGLGANALDSEALKRIFKAKNRPLDNPLIAHIADFEQLHMLTDKISPLTKTIMESFWPGPLSILLPARADLPKELTAGLPQVAVRMPSHELALGLIRAFGKPLAAPSANLSTRPSPTSSRHVLDDLAGKIAGVIDGGDCKVGIESTVIEVTDDRILILRPGGIDANALSVFGVKVEYDPSLSLADLAAAPRAPGQKYKHYAPQGNLQVVFCDRVETFWEFARDQVKKARLNGQKVAVLHEGPDVGADLVLPLGDSPKEASAKLYRILRTCDTDGIQVILAKGFTEDPSSTALLNRLYKASGGQFVDLRHL